MVNYQVVHSTVGRCRIRVPCLLNESEYLSKLLYLVEQLNFITKIHINPTASSIVFDYEVADEAMVVDCPHFPDDQSTDIAVKKLVDVIEQAQTLDITLVPQLILTPCPTLNWCRSDNSLVPLQNQEMLKLEEATGEVVGGALGEAVGGVVGEVVGGLLLGPVGVVMGECIGSCVGEVVGAEVGKEIVDAMDQINVASEQCVTQQQEMLINLEAAAGEKIGGAVGEAVGGLLLGPVGVAMGECIGACVGEVVGAEVGKEVVDAVEHVGAPQSAAQQQEILMQLEAAASEKIGAVAGQAVGGVMLGVAGTIVGGCMGKIIENVADQHPVAAQQLV